MAALHDWLLAAGISERYMADVLAVLDAEQCEGLADLRELSELPHFESLLPALTVRKIRRALQAPAPAAPAPAAPTTPARHTSPPASSPPDDRESEEQTPPELPRAPRAPKSGAPAAARRALFGGGSCSSTTTSEPGHDRHPLSGNPDEATAGIHEAASAAAWNPHAMPAHGMPACASRLPSLPAMSTQDSAAVLLQAAARAYAARAALSLARRLLATEALAGGLSYSAMDREMFVRCWRWDQLMSELAVTAPLVLAGRLLASEVRPGAGPAAVRLQAVVRGYLERHWEFYTMAWLCSWRSLSRASAAERLQRAWRRAALPSRDRSERRVLAAAARQNAGGLSRESAAELALIRASRCCAWLGGRAAASPAVYEQVRGEHSLPAATEAVAVADIARRAAAMLAGDGNLAQSIAATLSQLSIEIDDERRVWHVAAPVRLHSWSRDTLAQVVSPSDTPRPIPALPVLSRRGRKQAAALWRARRAARLATDDYWHDDYGEGAWDDYCMKHAFRQFMATANGVTSGDPDILFADILSEAGAGAA